MTASAPASAPPTSPRKPKKPRSRSAAGKGERFGCLKPVDNPLAVRSYVVALYGLIPLAGGVCGPVAVGMAIAGWMRRARKPDCGGGNFATAGLVLGGLETATHSVGLTLIARGLGWL